MENGSKRIVLLNNKKTKRLIEIARALKPSNFNYRTYHATFAFKGSKLLAIGINKPSQTHPKNLTLDFKDRDGNHIGDVVHTHSELSCFLKLGLEDCSNITFFNVRIDQNSNPALAKPCKGCQSLFKQIGYKKVYYTKNKNGDFEEL